jgi:PAS domain S-box-containing protein
LKWHRYCTSAEEISAASNRVAAWSWVEQLPSTVPADVPLLIRHTPHQESVTDTSGDPENAQSYVRDPNDRLTDLEAELHHLRQIFRLAPTFFAVLSGPDHVFRLVNDAYYQLVGHRDLIGKPLLTALPEIRGQGFKELLDEVLRTGEPFVARERPASVIRVPGGRPEEIFIDFVYEPLRDGGKVVGVVAHGSDVTRQVLSRRELEANISVLAQQMEEAKSLAEELERSNDQLQELNVELEEAHDRAEDARQRVTRVLESLDESVSVFDKAWRWTYLNSAARQLVSTMGKDADSLGGRVLWSEIPELQGTRFESEIRRAMETGTPAEYEEYVESLQRWFEIRAIPSSDGLTTFSRDVTERYLAAEALKQSEEQFRALANLIPTLAWMADEKGWIFWYNSRWYEYTGTTPEQMEGWGWQSVHDPAILPEVMERWTRSISTGEPFEMEFPLRSASGEFRWFLTRVAPTRANDGRITRWFGTNTDVQTQHEAREAADAANRAKSDFLAAMSHETRQPINATLAFLDLIDMGMYGPPSNEQREALGRIRKNQVQLLAVITDILSYARLEAGRIDLATAPVPVRDIFADLPALVEPQVLAKGLQLVVSEPSPELEVIADRERVLQILTNLVTNAVRATPAGGRISLRAETIGNDVSISVEDTGCGIPAGKLELVFAPFVQLDRALNHPREGVGLGLAISRDLAVAMGGTLSATSTLGEGSVFSLTLPASALD